LQQALVEWPLNAQLSFLLQKINSLAAYRLRAPQDLSALADQYRAALETLVNERRQAAEGPFGRSPLSKDRGYIREILRRLDALDAQRETLARLARQKQAFLGRDPIRSLDRGQSPQQCLGIPILSGRNQILTPFQEARQVGGPAANPAEIAFKRSSAWAASLESGLRA
jgi:hypothetical protein